MLEVLHVIDGLIHAVAAGFVCFYVIKAFRVLSKNPEMLKTQKKIWLPLLAGTLFFAAGGLFHFVNHLFFSNPEIDLSYDIVTLMGFLFLAVGIVQYSRLQIDYDKLKWAVAAKIHIEQSEETKA